jgi:hypothetical protein
MNTTRRLTFDYLGYSIEKKEIYTYIKDRKKGCWDEVELSCCAT